MLKTAAVGLFLGLGGCAASGDICEQAASGLIACGVGVPADFDERCAADPVAFESAAEASCPSGKADGDTCAAGGAPVGAPDLDKIEQLALQRYGSAAAETVMAWRRLIEESRALPDVYKLDKVNTFFNQRMKFESDTVIWGQEDYWSTPLEMMGRGMGDCEDFAIAKYVTLQLMGMCNERLRMIYVYATVNEIALAHMVLGFYAQPTNEPLILDNLISRMRPASMRPDLVQVYSFNHAGMWIGGMGVSDDPIARLSRWRDVLDRMRQEGLP